MDKATIETIVKILVSTIISQMPIPCDLESILSEYVWFLLHRMWT